MTTFKLLARFTACPILEPNQGCAISGALVAALLVLIGLIGLFEMVSELESPDFPASYFTGAAANVTFADHGKRCVRSSGQHLNGVL